MTWWAQHGSTAELRALQGGDEALFSELVVGLTPTLLRLARAYTQTPSAAQDAVQDTWVVVVDGLDRFGGRSSLKTWVCGILVHTARRLGVREGRSLPFSSLFAGEEPAVDPSRFAGRRDPQPAGTWVDPPVRWDEQPEGSLDARELRGVIDAAIAALPLRQREVITARDVLGLDAAEVADALGLSAGNQRVLLHRARNRVRAAVEDYGRESASTAAAEPRRTP